MRSGPARKLRRAGAAERSILQIDLFDLNGNIVQQLANGTYNAGRHVVIWNVGRRMHDARLDGTVDQGIDVAELVDDLLGEPRKQQGIVGGKPVPFRCQTVV